MTGTIKELIAGKTLHHSAMQRGYVSRKIEGIATKYDGKFGKGVKVLRPNYRSNRYCIVEYWI